jgi:hypothetical protein
VTGTSKCAAGPADLQGTGFYNLGTYCTSQSTGGAATGWLTTFAPVQGSEEMTLRAADATRWMNAIIHRVKALMPMDEHLHPSGTGSHADA